MRSQIRAFRNECKKNKLEPSKVKEFFRLYIHSESRWMSDREVNEQICFAVDDGGEQVKEAIKQNKR